MSWASRRQFTYLGGVLLFIAGILFLYLYPKFHVAPTCTDNKKNGTELGVDCGGVCSQFCSFQVSTPVVLWSRAFLVSGNTYNLMAYVENQNKNAAAKYATYEFRIYDTDNKLIGRREGVTFIPPNTRFPVFESRFESGTSIPKNVTFSFTNQIIWVKKDPINTEVPITVDRIVLGDSTSSPSLFARVTNDSILDLPPFDFFVILYDDLHNAIAVSKTHREGLKSSESANLSFTWPQAFSSTPVVKEVIPSINPFFINQ